MAYTGLAKTTFMAGPDDAAVAADAYTSTDINSASVETVDYSLSLPESPLGLKIRPPGLSDVGLKAPTLEQADVINAITQSDTSIKNCFNNMGDAAKKLLSIPGKMLGKVEAVINGVVTKLKNLESSNGFDLKKALEKIGNLKAIGCSANSLSNGNYALNIVDKGGMSGLIAGITTQASFHGINNVFSSISNVITDKDILLGAASGILPAATRDFGLLKDLSSTGIAKSLKSMMPSISGNSISNFRINPGTTSLQLPSLYSNMKYALDRVDQSWKSTTRDGAAVLSGVNTVNSSASDFHKVMSASVMSEYSLIPTPVAGHDIIMPTYASDEMFLMTTNGLGVQDVSSLLKNQFPSVPMTINPISVNESISTNNNYSNYSTTENVSYVSSGDKTLSVLSSSDGTTTVSENLAFA